MFRQIAQYFHSTQYFHTPYRGCLREIEIQIFKKYGYLIGRYNRLYNYNNERLLEKGLQFDIAVFW